MKNLTIEQLNEICEPLQKKYLAGEFMSQKDTLKMWKATYLITALKHNWKH